MALLSNNRESYKFLIIVGLLFLFQSGSCQNIISGQVLDSLTHEPIQFANVYLANTQIGTSTNENGEFTFGHFPSGKYDLIASFLGFETLKKSILFSESTQTLQIYLKPEARRLNEVVVRPAKLKYSDFIKFKDHFLGENQNASNCEIVNINDLILYQEDNYNGLYALSRAPLEIKNEAMGYKLIYSLESFSVNFDSLTQRYTGVPRFEELTPVNSEQYDRWRLERKRAYEGSFVHLIHCLRDGRVTNPFILHELYRIPNRNRPSESILRNKINVWKKELLESKGMRDNKAIRDSVNYYVDLYNKPIWVDSIGQLITDPRQLLDETREHITYTGLLHIIYVGEEEEKGYIKLNKSKHGYEQHSIIHFKKKGISIFENGYYEPQLEVFFDGYMMWSDRISNLLPWDYTP